MEFMGYPRPDGSAGARNFVAVIPAVQCDNELADRIAAEVLPWRDVLISGWGLAGEGMGKISKSRGGECVGTSPAECSVIHCGRCALVPSGCRMIRKSSAPSLERPSTSIS